MESKYILKNQSAGAVTTLDEEIANLRGFQISTLAKATTELSGEGVKEQNSHYIWYAFPHDEAGKGDTYNTKLSHKLPSRLALIEADKEEDSHKHIWKNYLERFTTRMEEWNDDKNVSPIPFTARSNYSKDWRRILKFIKFWQPNINVYDTWLQDVINTLKRIISGAKFKSIVIDMFKNAGLSETKQAELNLEAFDLLTDVSDMEIDWVKIVWIKFEFLKKKKLDVPISNIYEFLGNNDMLQTKISPDIAFESFTNLLLEYGSDISKLFDIVDPSTPLSKDNMNTISSEEETNQLIKNLMNTIYNNDNNTWNLENSVLFDLNQNNSSIKKIFYYDKINHIKYINTPDSKTDGLLKQTYLKLNESQKIYQRINIDPSSIGLDNPICIKEKIKLNPYFSMWENNSCWLTSALFSYITNIDILELNHILNISNKFHIYQYFQNYTASNRGESILNSDQYKQLSSLKDFIHKSFTFFKTLKDLINILYFSEKPNESLLSGIIFDLSKFRNNMADLYEYRIKEQKEGGKMITTRYSITGHTNSPSSFFQMFSNLIYPHMNAVNEMVINQFTIYVFENDNIKYSDNVDANRIKADNFMKNQSEYYFTDVQESIREANTIDELAQDLFFNYIYDEKTNTRMTHPTYDDNRYIFPKYDYETLMGEFNYVIAGIPNMTGVESDENKRKYAVYEIIYFSLIVGLLDNFCTDCTIDEDLDKYLDDYRDSTIEEIIDSLKRSNKLKSSYMIILTIIKKYNFDCLNIKLQDIINFIGKYLDFDKLTSENLSKVNNEIRNFIIKINNLYKAPQEEAGYKPVQYFGYTNKDTNHKMEAISYTDIDILYKTIEVSDCKPNNTGPGSITDIDECISKFKSYYSTIKSISTPPPPMPASIKVDLKNERTFKEILVLLLGILFEVYPTVVRKYTKTSVKNQEIDHMYIDFMNVDHLQFLKDQDHPDIKTTFLENNIFSKTFKDLRDNGIEILSFLMSAQKTHVPGQTETSVNHWWTYSKFNDNWFYYDDKSSPTEKKVDSIKVKTYKIWNHSLTRWEEYKKDLITKKDPGTGDFAGDSTGDSAGDSTGDSDTTNPENYVVPLTKNISELLFTDGFFTMGEKKEQDQIAMIGVRIHPIS